MKYVKMIYLFWGDFCNICSKFGHKSLIRCQCVLIMEASVLGNGTFRTLVTGLLGPKTIVFPDVKKIVRVGPFLTGRVG